MPLTEAPPAPEGSVYVPCLLVIEDCPKCEGTGWQLKKACARCMGGKVPGKCPDCRGVGWREDIRDF